MPCSESVQDTEKTSSVFIADIVSVDGPRIICERAGQLFSAFRGTSLLLDPLPGDQAVAVDSGNGLSFVIAIVSSSREKAARSMTLPEETSIRSSGTISISSGEKIRLETGRLDLEGVWYRLRFSEVSIESTLLKLSGSLLSFAAGKLEQIARHIETTAHRLSVRAHMATKEVSTVDRSVSGQTLIESESLLSMGSKNTIIRSSDWVKVDSGQIHLG